jgi:hypothetical protein
LAAIHAAEVVLRQYDQNAVSPHFQERP